LHKQKEFQNEIFELEQSIAVLQKESKQAIKEAEVERDDIFDKAEKQMDAVRESDLLIDHLKNAAEMDVLPKLQALQSEIEAIDKQTHETRVGMQQESVSDMYSMCCVISTV
jgi:F0F1-type ATP synthase membrane subunit b/b'